MERHFVVTTVDADLADVLKAAGFTIKLNQDGVVGFTVNVPEPPPAEPLYKWQVGKEKFVDQNAAEAKARSVGIEVVEI